MMKPIEGKQANTIEPVEVINQALEDAWAELCQYYGVTGSLPDLQDLFYRVNLAEPDQAAEDIVVSMLQEVTEQVGRFSSWYKQPARTFGLTSVSDRRTNQTKWMLAQEALLQWHSILERLTRVIERYGGLIEALVLVADLIEELPDDPCVVVQCNCYPALTIQLRKSVFDQAHIICRQCQHPFVEVA